MNLNKAEDIYESLVNGESNLDSAVAFDTLVNLREVVDNKKTELRGRSKTSQLWLNYQSMVRVSRSLIKADRTGSWQMHLRAVSDCLPIFAATGHFSYLKSAHYYIQEMNQSRIDTQSYLKGLNKGPMLSVARISFGQVSAQT